MGTFVWRFPEGPRGRSSVGRALEWHSRGQGFDSPRLHWSNRVEKRVGYQSGQMEQTVNLPAYAYVGSNPTPTIERVRKYGSARVREYFAEWWNAVAGG